MKTRWTIHTMIRVSKTIPVNICQTMCLSSRIPSLRKMNCGWKKERYLCKVGRDPFNTLNITVYTVCKYSAATFCSVKLWGECCSIHLASSKNVNARLYQNKCIFVQLCEVYLSIEKIFCISPQLIKMKIFWNAIWCFQKMCDGQRQVVSTMLKKKVTEYLFLNRLSTR